MTSTALHTLEKIMCCNCDDLSKFCDDTSIESSKFARKTVVSKLFVC